MRAPLHRRVQLWSTGSGSGCPSPQAIKAVEETVTDNQKADRPDRLSVERKVVHGVLVVTVQGEIDYDVKDALSEALMSEDGTAAPPRIVADLSGVTFMDSSGINVFIAAYQQVSGALPRPCAGRWTTRSGVPRARTILPHGRGGMHPVGRAEQHPCCMHDADAGTGGRQGE